MYETKCVEPSRHHGMGPLQGFKVLSLPLPPIPPPMLADSLAFSCKALFFLLTLIHSQKLVKVSGGGVRELRKPIACLSEGLGAAVEWEVRETGKWRRDRSGGGGGTGLGKDALASKSSRDCCLEQGYRK